MAEHEAANDDRRIIEEWRERGVVIPVPPSTVEKSEKLARRLRREVSHRAALAAAWAKEDY